MSLSADPTRAAADLTVPAVDVRDLVKVYQRPGGGTLRAVDGFRSRSGGLASVVRDGGTGLLVEGHKPAEWAGPTIQLLGDLVGAEQMGRRANPPSQRFTWSRTASRLSAAIARLPEPQLRVQARALQDKSVMESGPQIDEELLSNAG